MAITRELADSYFETTVTNTVWTGFEVAERNASITQAIRELTYLKGAAISPATTENTDRPREDLAVYEYAKNLLVSSPAVGSGVSESPDELFADIEAGQSGRSIITSLVMQYMGWTIRINRG